MPQPNQSTTPVASPQHRYAAGRPRFLRGTAFAATALLAAALTFPGAASANVGAGRPVNASSPEGPSAAAARNLPSLLDSLRGRSRKLRARFVSPSRTASLPILRELFGDSAASRPAVHTANLTEQEEAAEGPFHFITMRPFTDKVRGRIGTYRIGNFPSEQRSARGGTSGNPEGFLEITTTNQDTPVSEHFRLKDFLTKDQATVWPKYLVLREPLVDKLELVLDELRGMGVAVQRMRVMSGFRTPQYNAQGVGAGGRVQDSRHQYGDAADVYIVNGTRDWMSDLNGDGRVDLRDARVLAAAADRVEKAHPDLVGGIGVYPATSAHGPFVHIDVRGTKARWGSL